MRLATFLDGGRARLGVVREGRLLPVTLADTGFGSIRELVIGGEAALARLRAWTEAQRRGAWRPLAGVELAAAVPDPGAIYAIGQNYRGPGEPPAQAGRRPERPLVFAKLPSSVAGHGATLAWDHALTATVDPEAELGVVIGQEASCVAPADAMAHVFGYTCVNDVSSRDPWLDGDQWLLGKSLAGFCPVGPWVVTRDELDPAALRLGCRIAGVAIQDGSTAEMRFPIPDQIAYLSRHVPLHPGDLIATGTPARLGGPPGPERHLEPGDEVTVWVEGIGELTTRVARTEGGARR